MWRPWLDRRISAGDVARPRPRTTPWSATSRGRCAALEQGRALAVRDLYVAPGERGLRHGAGLLARALDRARSDGVVADRGDRGPDDEPPAPWWPAALRARSASARPARTASSACSTCGGAGVALGREAVALLVEGAAPQLLAEALHRLAPGGSGRSTKRSTRSWKNGSSRCRCDTRLIDMPPQHAQRTATPTTRVVARPATGAPGATGSPGAPRARRRSRTSTASCRGAGGARRRR